MFTRAFIGQIWTLTARTVIVWIRSDRWSIPLNQALSLLTSAVLLANSSALHGQELHANAEELPTFVLAIIGGAAIVAYYWIRKHVIGRKKSRRR